MRENRSHLFESAPPPCPAERALDCGCIADVRAFGVQSPAPIVELRARDSKIAHEDADARGRVQQQIKGTVALESYRGRAVISSGLS